MTYPPRIHINFYVDPEVVLDIYGLGNPIEILLPYMIANHENIGLYFEVEIANPNSDWVNTTYRHGLVDTGTVASGIFIPKRYQPSLSGGEYTETKKIKWNAYRDSAYTDLYTTGEIYISFIFFDHGDGAFTLIDRDTFDDGTLEGWAGSSTTIHPLCGYSTSFSLDSSRCLSPPYSIRISTAMGGHIYKSFSLASYSKGYATIHCYKVSGGTMVIYREYTKQVLNPGLFNILPSNRWYRVSFKLVGYTTNTIRIASNAASSIDEIYVVGK